MIQEEIRCVEMVEVVTEWMEDALDDAQRVSVEAHLAICPHCTAYLDQLRTTTEIAARVDHNGSVEAVPAEVKDRLLAAFRASRPS